jgi:quinolinate synthase
MENTELIERILDLKRQRQALILAHNYQRGEIQDIADFVGDSLDLSQTAAITDAKVIVFCGVHFMAETASILSPDKTVLFPDINAGCPMANMITANQLRDKKRELSFPSTVCYVNSSAEVKAESDICCTSANAIRVVKSLGSDEILFVPDQYLGHYISIMTNKELSLWPGYCPTHAKIMPEDILRLKQDYPEAKVIVHPECRPEVINLADGALSTSGIISFAQRTEAEVIVVGTETGILHRLRKENSTKRFLPASEQAVCPNMKKITLEKILWSLEELSPEVKVPEEIRHKAKRAVDKMLSIGRTD